MYRSVVRERFSLGFLQRKGFSAEHFAFGYFVLLSLRITLELCSAEKPSHERNS
jgi:hypothetical protein